MGVGRMGHRQRLGRLARQADGTGRGVRLVGGGAGGGGVGGGGAGGGGAGAPGTAWAAGPKKPMELVVGFAAGGGTDTTARTLALHLSRRLGVPVVVSNKPGASGELGLAHVAKSAPDGYLIGMSNMPGLVTLPMERRTRFKAGDFAYIANIVRDP